MDAWDIDWARDMIANGGRFGPKRVREAVYKHNVAVFADWARGGDGGIALGDRQALLDGTRVYARAFSVADAPKVEGEMKTGAINADCIDVAEELVRDGYKPAILNLASRWHACGGYHDGTSAQEESLCQNSTLSQSLYQYFDSKKKCVRDANVPMRFNAYPLDLNFGGIYSPGVTFFRTGRKGAYAFRESPFSCGVITVAALSFRETNRYNNSELRYRSDDGGFTPEGESIMLDKIRTIYRLALKNGHDSIVLGAFGCGVFHLRPGFVAAMFERVLEEDEFKDKFRALPFAILEGRGTPKRPVEENGKFAAFYRQFGRWV